MSGMYTLIHFSFIFNQRSNVMGKPWIFIVLRELVFIVALNDSQYIKLRNTIPVADWTKVFRKQLVLIAKGIELLMRLAQ